MSSTVSITNPKRIPSESHPPIPPQRTCLASAPVSNFIVRHPTTKMLALAFLMLIGVALVADGFDVHIPRGYIYFAMAFAGAVEVFNVLAARRRRGAG